MASRKSELYNALKACGWVPEKHYREYNVPELLQLADENQLPEPEPEPADDPPADFFRAPTTVTNDEMAGERQNTKLPEDVIRVDEQGRYWLQEEVRKPAYPKPRGRRVLTYMDTGVEKQSTRVGDYVETFEVAGKGPGKASEIKITLPSYQVGVYRDKRFPFKVICYNGREGFDLFDVEQYYGGRELVPATAKRVYISNTLCYDMRSVIRAIQEEYRHQQLTGRVK